MFRDFTIKNFSIKFIDIMIGVVLGLGFQWWVNLKDTWQVIAFIYCYLDIIDYWIDYGPCLKKFPPKKEIDVFLDVAIVFSLFLYIYATQIAIIYFLLAFVMLRLFDFFWLLSSKQEYQPTNFDKVYVNTWLIFDLMEIIWGITLVGLILLSNITPLIILIIYIVGRILLRIFASLKYKRAFFG